MASNLLEIFILVLCFQTFSTLDNKQTDQKVNFTLNFEDEKTVTSLKKPESIKVQTILNFQPNSDDIKTIENKHVIKELHFDKPEDTKHEKRPEVDRKWELKDEKIVVPNSKIIQTDKLNARKRRDLNDRNPNKTRIARQIYPFYSIPIPIYDYPRYVEPHPNWHSHHTTTPRLAAPIYPIPVYTGIPVAWPFSFPYLYPTDPISWPNRAGSVSNVNNNHDNRAPTYVNPNEHYPYPHSAYLPNEQNENNLLWKTTPHPNQIPKTPKSTESPDTREICKSQYLRNCPGITRIDGEIRRPIHTEITHTTNETLQPTPFSYPQHKPTLPPPSFISSSRISPTTKRPQTTIRPIFTTTPKSSQQSPEEKCQENDLTKCPGFSNININKKILTTFKPSTSSVNLSTTVRPEPEVPECTSSDIRNCPGFTDINTNVTTRLESDETNSNYSEDDYQEEIDVVPNPSIGTKEPSRINYDDVIPDDCVEDDITKCKGYNPVTIPPLKHSSPPPLRSTKTKSDNFCDENDVTKCPGFAELSTRKPSRTIPVSNDTEQEKRDNAGRCVWAIVTCCKRDPESVRKGCFTIMGCPQTEWKDMDPCSETFSQKTLAVTKKYYR